MADKTMGFKITEEMHEKTKQIIEESGFSAKEWLEKAVALYQVQQMKEHTTEFTTDLNELEHHTQRIYTLVANMMERSRYLRDQAISDSTDLVKQKDVTIANLQKQLQEKETEVQSVHAEYDALNDDIAQLEAQNKEIADTMGDKQALIKSYSDKINQLENDVAASNSMKNDFAELKKEYDKLQANVQQRLKEADKEAQKAYQLNHDLEQQLAAIEERHAKDLQYVKMEQQALKNNELVAMTRQHQQEINQLHATYNERIEQLLSPKEEKEN